VLVFFATRTGRDCERQLDVIEDVRRQFPGVRFAAVAVRGDRDALRRLIRRHDWGFPVGYDRDGAVANLYGVAVCPTTSFAYPGRSVMETSLGFLDRRKLTERVNRLVAESRRRTTGSAGGARKPAA
jgi:AhpC/TSA family protein